jgi:hypothetical protein
LKLESGGVIGNAQLVNVQGEGRERIVHSGSRGASHE